MIISDYKKELSEQNQRIKGEFFKNLDPFVASQNLADLYDSIITQLYNLILKGREVAVFALGSYGRKSLAPFSDIDIMLLVEDAAHTDFEEEAEEFLRNLWDLGYDVGHSYIDLQNWKPLAGKDHIFLTNLMDARLVCGSTTLAHKFYEEYEKFLREYDLRRYIEEKMKSIRKARQKYGNSFLLKEPNIKESPGGLRDFHLIIWLAHKAFGLKDWKKLPKMGIFEKEDIDTINESLKFIMRVRFILQYETGKSENILNLSMQHIVARVLKYRGNRWLTAVEQFMRDYYRAAKKLHFYSKSFLRLLYTRSEGRIKELDDFFYVKNKHIYPKSEDVFRKEPLNFLRVFLYAKKYNYYLHYSTDKLIERELFEIKRIRRNAEAARIFLDIISRVENLARTLKYMHFTGVLGGYIPEFARIDCLYQEEEYHQYTVDEHILKAIERLEKLHYSRKKSEQFYKQLLYKLPDFKVLVLAILLHDIGKFQGKGHAKKGARLTPKILKQIYVPIYVIREVTELVEKHLLMAHTFQMHDIENEDIIRSFATEVRDVNFLNYLTLLTYFDISSVADNVWTAWKSTLLQMLYKNAYDYLLRGTLAVTEMHQYAEQVRIEVLETYRGTPYESIAQDFLQKVPEKYLLSYSLYQILYHIKVVYRARGKEIFITHRYLPRTKSYMITICTRDQLRLFSNIAGALSYFKLSIVSADVFTRSDGLAVDTIYFTAPFKITRYDWEKIKKFLCGVIRGEFNLEERLKPQTFKRTSEMLVVEFDNELLQDYTVAYIRAPDRIGLLYHITGAFADEKMTIKYSKIMTEGGMAIDTFYFTDYKGHKVIQEAKLRFLKKRIMERIECIM